MTSVRAALSGSASLVTPSQAEERKMRRLAESMLKKVREASREFPEVRGVLLGGSFAKGTWLPRDVDLDIFVKFAGEVPEGRFEAAGLEIGRRAVRGYEYGKKYAQHPYTEAVVEGVKVNVVPCYDVEPGQWRSAADRSPYHVEFVRKELGAAAKTQVRLLKKFMKTTEVYGAEIEQEGFSGYAAEVLIYLHRNVEGVLRYFATLRPEGETLLSLRDPVDEQRELATAISKETVAKMVLASRAFLAGPSQEYFIRVKRRTRARLEKSLYCIVFDHESLSEDTLWGELKKSTRQVVKHAEAQGFVVSRSSAASDGSGRSAIILLPQVAELPELQERPGPGVERASEVRKFISKNAPKAELIWAGQDARVHVLQRRRFTDLGELLRSLCGAEIASVGASREVAAGIRKSGRVLSGEELVREAKKQAWLRRGVERVVTDTIGTNPDS